MTAKTSRRPVKAKNPYPRVSYKWADAYSVDGWTPVEDIQGMIDRRSEHADTADGRLVASNDKWAVVAASTTYDDETKKWSACASMVIPKAWLVKNG